jgi:hypothetical protein
MVQLIAKRPELSLAFELVEGANTAYSTCLTEPFYITERWLRSFE